MDEFKLIITSDKSFKDYELLKQKVNNFIGSLPQKSQFVIVSDASEVPGY